MAMNNNYSAEVGIKFNDTRLKSQLKTIESKTINLNLQLSRGTSTQINSINKALNKMKITTSSTVAEMNALGDRTTVAMKNVKRSVDTTSKSIEGASKHAHTLGSKFVDITKKVIAFGAITSAIGLFTQAMSQAVKVVGEFDASLTEFRKVSDLSGDALDDYTDKLGKIGIEVARTKSEMISASTEFVKGGYSEEDSAMLAKVASLYQNVADSELTAGDSASYIISQMKAFNLTTSDAMGIIDQTNQVANEFAVSSTDISQALSKTAGAMSVLGNDFSETISIVTAGSEVLTNQAGKVSKGLRTVGNNLADTAKKTGILSFGVGGVTKTLDLLDKKTGDLKSTYAIFDDISKSWDKMSNSEKQSLAIQISGKNQMEVTSAVLNNWKTAVDALTTAQTASGSATKENAKYMDSFAARIKALQTQFELLVTGDGGLANFIKIILSGATSLLKFATNTKLINVVLVATGVIFSSILIPKLMLFGSTLLTNIGYIALFTAETGSLSAGLKAVGISASIAQIGLVGLTLIISAGVMAWNAYTNAQEEAKQAQEELYKSNIERYKQATDTLEKLKSEKLTRIELLQIVNGFSEAYGREVDAIKNTDDARKKSIELIEAEKKAKAQSIIDTSMSKYKEAKSGLSESGTIVNPAGYNEAIDGEEVKYNGIEDKITKLIALKDKYFKQAEKYSSNPEGRQYEANTELAKYYEAQIANTTSQQSKFHQSISDLDTALTVVGKTYDTSKNKVRDLTDGEKLLGRASANIASQEDKHAESQKALVSAEKSRVDGLQSVSDSIDSIQSAYTTLDDAVSEYNKTGNFSLDTLQSLMSLSPDYLSMLEMQNGKLVLNEKSMRKKIAASLEEGKQLIWNTAAEKLNALEKQSNAVISINSASDWIEYQNQIRNTTTELNKNSGAEAYNKALKSTASTDVDQKKRQKIINDTKSQIKLLNSATAGIKSRSTAIVENTDNTKKESSAIDKSIDKLEKKKDKLDALKDRYSSLFEAIQDAYDLEIDKLEKSKDANEEVHQTNIDYLNTLIDKENDLIEAKEKESESEIDRLEKKKKAQDDYYDNELSKLEKTNDEQNKSLELQEKQEALAKAKSQRVMVYDKGEWKYIQDQGAVETARKELQSTITSQELEKQKEAIESLKDASDESYDRQIENQENLLKEYQKAHEGVISNLENLIKSEETAQKKEDKVYEKKIKNINNLKESVEKLSNKYQDLANVKLINKYLDGDTNDLSQISKIASTYTKLQKTIATMQSAIDKKNDKKDNSTSKKKSSRSSSAIGQEVSGNISSFDRSGVNYVNSDSSINNILTSNKSSINRINTSTNYASRSTTTSQSFHFDKIELPNVNNAESFVSSLSSKFNNYVIQKTNSFG